VAVLKDAWEQIRVNICLEIEVFIKRPSYYANQVQFCIMTRLQTGSNICQIRRTRCGAQRDNLLRSWKVKSPYPT